MSKEQKNMSNNKKYLDYKFTCKDRFLEYVRIDTQSDEDSKSIPSTEKQKDLLKMLLSELKSMKIDATMDGYGYIYARIRSNTDKKVPAIGFISHVDTSPAAPGKNVRPMIHEGYRGGKITLPKENQSLDIKDSPELSRVIGHDIITSDGSTLLGADDKAGVAEIMDAANYLMKHPEIRHGDIMIAFTMDEEIGRGVDKFDIKKFGAKYAYTVDGDDVGSIESETFNADGMTITFIGKSIHTGYAKGVMINSVRIAAEFIEALPKKSMTPETTSGKQGFVHASEVKGSEGSTSVKMYLRDFTEKRLVEYETMLKKLAMKISGKYPGSRVDFKITKQYRNMKKIVDKSPQIMDNAIEAMKNLGINPNVKIVRGGTDGCNLSYKGLPTPNIFSGEHNFHSKTEWVSVQEMEFAVKTILEIIKVWEEKS